MNKVVKAAYDREYRERPYVKEKLKLKRQTRHAKDLHNIRNKKYKVTTRAERYKKSPISYLLEVAKTRAKKQGLEFNVTAEDVVFQEFCPVFGYKLDILNNNIRTGASLDRKDNAAGYIKGNVFVISRRANLLKSDMTVKEVTQLLQYMKEAA